MLKIRYILILLGALLSPPASAEVQVSIGIGTPHFSIGINVPSYPRFVAVPGYPVYYAPNLQANFFFYDGMYWVYQDDYWYASSWYDGPWWLVEPEIVPVFVLRVPVRYYRHPPAYFHGWRQNAPPRWGDHWGHDWEQHRSGWDNWDRHSAPAPAPLPVYQREYSGDRYPRQVEQQYELRERNYRYQPSEPVVRQHYEEQAVKRAPAQQATPQQERQGAPEDRNSRQQDMQRSTPRQQEGPAGPRSESPQQRGADVQRSAPASPPQGRPETRERRKAPDAKDFRQQDMQRSAPRQQEGPAGPRPESPQQRGEDVPRSESPQQRGADVQRSNPVSTPPGRPEAHDQRPPSQPGANQREQRMPKSQGQEQRQQGRDATGRQNQDRGQEQERGGWDPHQ